MLLKTLTICEINTYSV